MEVAKIREGSNLNVSLALAMNNYGITFLSDGLVKLLNKEVHFNYYHIQGLEIPFNFVYSTRKTWSMPPYAKYFISIVKELSK